LQSQQAFYGVWGNVDSDGIKSTLPEKQVFLLAAYQVGLYHGHGTGGTTADRAFQAFASENVDIIIFGHSHQPCIFTRNKIIMLNPGSITAKRKERWFSYIVLDLEPTGISARLVFLNDC
jgi:putative phosphoesterase